jgi:hypothetical protein
MIQIQLEDKDEHCQSMLTPELCQAVEQVKESLNEFAQDESTTVSLYVLEPLEDDWQKQFNSFTLGNCFGLEWTEPIMINHQLVAYQAWVLEDNDEFSCYIVPTGVDPDLDEFLAAHAETKIGSTHDQN